MEGLAYVDKLLGQPDAYEKLYEEMNDIRLKTLKEESYLDITGVMSVLASFYFDVKGFDESADMYSAASNFTDDSYSHRRFLSRHLLERG